MSYPIDESLFATLVRRELQDAREGPEVFEERGVEGRMYVVRKGGHPPINTPHEAYAIILEELEEFWEQCRLKKAERSLEAMLQELVQIGAMAQRAAEDLGLVHKG